MKTAIFSLAALSMAVMPLTAQAHSIGLEEVIKYLPHSATPRDLSVHTMFLEDYSQWVTLENYTEIQDKYRGCVEHYLLKKFRMFMGQKRDFSSAQELLASQEMISWKEKATPSAQELLTKCYYPMRDPFGAGIIISDDAHSLWTIYIHLHSALPPFKMLVGEWEESRALIERAVQEHEDLRTVISEEKRKAEEEYVAGELERLTSAGLLKAE